MLELPVWWLLRRQYFGACAVPWRLLQPDSQREQQRRVHRLSSCKLLHRKRLISIAVPKRFVLPCQLIGARGVSWWLFQPDRQCEQQRGVYRLSFGQLLRRQCVDACAVPWRLLQPESQCEQHHRLLELPIRWLLRRQCVGACAVPWRLLQPYRHREQHRLVV